MTEGHKESAGPAGLSSELNASTGTLCQEDAFSNNQENVCLTSGGETLFSLQDREKGSGGYWPWLH